MLKSHKEDTVDLAANFCIILIQHEPRVKLSDLVGYDFESRDIIMKKQSKDLQSAIKDLNEKY